MKHTQRILACLLAGVLALSALAGCSGMMMIATVQTDRSRAQTLMGEIGSGLQYDTALERDALQLADWLVQEPGQLGTSDGRLVRKVQLDPNSGNMSPSSINDFILTSSDYAVIIRESRTIAMEMYCDGNPYYDPGRLYAPAADDAAALSGYAAGCSRMGAVFIEYGGVSYVVAVFE